MCFSYSAIHQLKYLSFIVIILNFNKLLNFRGKKGFGFKRLILLSDMGGEFGDDQIDTIVAGIKNSGTELNVM